MKRLGFLLLALTLLLALLPVAAQSTPDLTALAQYFPANTPVYVSLRTDDGHFSALESIRSRIAAALPTGLTNGTTVPMALDQFVSSMFQADETFADDVRPWLGDSMAFGLLNLDAMTKQQDNGPYVIALGITDRAAAEAFFLEFMQPRLDIQVETTDAYTLLTPSHPDMPPMALYIDDQVLIITNKPDALPAGGPIRSPLSEADMFQTAIAALPADQYNIVVYADYGAFMQAAMAEARTMNRSDAAMMDMMQPMFAAFGGSALGFTLLDERAMTMDMALNFDVSALDTMMPAVGSLTPFDPAFAVHLPAGTQLAIQGANLSQPVQQGLDNLVAMQAMDAPAGANMPTADEMMSNIDFVVRGATGLDLEDDILSWMTGQYAVGMSIDLPELMNAAFSGDLPADALSFGLVIENTDQQGAQALVAGLTHTLNGFITPEDSGSVRMSEETLGGAPGVVITDVASGFQLAFGGNDAVFALGTADMVRAALSPDGGLNTDPAYQESLSWALDGGPVYLYASGEILNNLVELGIHGEMTRFSARGADSVPEFGTILNSPLFSSSSISENYTESAITARFVLTLE